MSVECCAFVAEMRGRPRLIDEQLEQSVLSCRTNGDGGDLRRSAVRRMLLVKYAVPRPRDSGAYIIGCLRTHRETPCSPRATTRSEDRWKVE